MKFHAVDPNFVLGNQLLDSNKKSCAHAVRSGHRRKTMCMRNAGHVMTGEGNQLVSGTSNDGGRILQKETSCISYRKRSIRVSRKAASTAKYVHIPATALTKTR